MPGSGFGKERALSFPLPPHHHLNKHFSNKSVKKNCNFTRVALQSVPKLYLAWNSLLLNILPKPILNHSAGFWKTWFQVYQLLKGQIGLFPPFPSKRDFWERWFICLVRDFCKILTQKIKQEKILLKFLFFHRKVVWKRKLFWKFFLATFQHRFWVVLYLGPGLTI